MKALNHSENAADVISRGADILGIQIDRSQTASMLRYIALLLEWRHRSTLTSLTRATDIAALHFLDALTVFKVLPRVSGTTLLDVGTGAGFPGLVLRIADDSLALTLLDRDARKIVFLKHVVHELGLANVKFLNTTLENLLADPPSPGFEAVISRAFSSDSKVLDSLAPLLTDSGRLVRMAGPSSSHQELTLDNFTEIARWEGDLPFVSRHRLVVAYRRV